MRHCYRFNLFVLGGLAACIACPGAHAKAVRVQALPADSRFLTLGSPAADLMNPLYGGDLPLTGLGRPPFARSSFVSSDTAPSVEHQDFGRIGGLALISRELDRYGRIRGVDFLAYSDPDSRWDMKLSVKHGAVFQITHRWGGGGPSPFSGRGKSRLVSDNR